MVAGFALHLELESFFRTFFCCSLRFNICDVSTVAECSVKNNSQLLWACGVFKFFVAPRYVQLSVGFSVSYIVYACLCLFRIDTQVVSTKVPMLSNELLRIDTVISNKTPCVAIHKSST